MLERLFLLLGVHLVEPYTDRGFSPSRLAKAISASFNRHFFLAFCHICSLYIATRPPDIQYFVISSNTKRIDYCAPHSTGIPLGCIVLCVRVYQQTGESWTSKWTTSNSIEANSMIDPARTLDGTQHQYTKPCTAGRRRA